MSASTPPPRPMQLVLLALGVVAALGYAISGPMLALALFVGGALIVAVRTLARTRAALREPELPALDRLAPQQALAVLAATHGKVMTTPMLDRVEALTQAASVDPRGALADVRVLVRQSPRAVPALLLCARLELELDEAGATRTWSRAITTALDTGLNRLAARSFADHAAHRDALELGPEHLQALANALLHSPPAGADAGATAELVRWCRDRARRV
ncbi:MAG: hypothetical protein K1X88_23015 [Nannocystaceae bacterium]|nr:hypothetical protein [Nannocystaceae bacterium]